MAFGPITSWEIDGETVETVSDFIFSWAPKSLQMVTAAMKLKDTPWKVSCDQPREHIKKQRHYFVNKGLSRQGYGFSSGHIWMWELDCEESWAPKNWCFWTVVLEKTLASPLDWKEIQPVHSFFFFNFYCYFILLYNTVLVLPYIDMNPPWVYMRSPTWTPLPGSGWRKTSGDGSENKETAGKERLVSDDGSLTWVVVVQAVKRGQGQDTW